MALRKAGWWPSDSLPWSVAHFKTHFKTHNAYFTVVLVAKKKGKELFYLQWRINI